MSSICVAGHPRSGSTYLCQTLDKHPEIKSYLEIFHSNIEVIKSHLRGDYDYVMKTLGFAEPNDPKSLILSQIQEYVCALERKNQLDIVFKIFPGHLNYAQMETLMGKCKFVIVLNRNLLHSFISDKIATELQRWGGVDTTSKKIHFDQDSFVQHVIKTLDFYKNVKNIAAQKGLSVVELHYESLFQEQDTSAYLHGQFKGLISPLFKKEFIKPSIKRQDSRELAQYKVSNPKDLLNFLKPRGLMMLNDNRQKVNTSCYQTLLKNA